MADIAYIVADSIFAAIPTCVTSPETPLPSSHSLYEPGFVASASLSEIVDCTYNVLKQGDLSLQKALKIWEIRLTVMLFADKLPLAKREAINLNNALYLHENPSAVASPSAQPDVKQRTSSPTPAIYICPLPKNNDGAIGSSLLLLLLRLKTPSNLARVNEIYKLCYQVRLRGDLSEEKDTPVDIQGRLIGLAYEVASILFVTKNYSTLLSFLNSLRNYTAKIQDDASCAGEYSSYVSNFTLMWFLTKILTRQARSLDCTILNDLFEDQFSAISDRSWDALRLVLKSIAPRVGGPKIDSESIPEVFTIDKLAAMISKDEISIRTICCVLSVWDLAATYETTLDAQKLIVKIEKEDSDVGSVYCEILGRWGLYFNKLFGME